MSLFDLAGTTSVVIAGSSTLGSAMAGGLAAHGSRVALVGRSDERLAPVRERLLAAGAECASFVGEATERADLERIRDAVVAWSGRVDVLLNCAGKNSTTPFFEVDPGELREIMRINVESVVLACQTFAARMIEQGSGGSIINVSSVSADPPLSRVFGYSASKAALDNVTRFLARELAPHRIRVNAIVPGFFPAEQNRAILTTDRTEAILGHTPMARFGEPDELQGAAVWLAAAKASSFVTGALIRVDGGFGATSI